jgi:hypothetical protein
MWVAGNTKVAKYTLKKLDISVKRVTFKATETLQITETNQQFIETMSLAINLMESNNLNDIIKYWPILQDLISEEKHHEQQIAFLTEKLLNNSRFIRYRLEQRYFRIIISRSNGM